MAGLINGSAYMPRCLNFMSLDKLTLHAALALLAKNASDIDTTIAQKTTALQQLTVELERIHGARQYHDMVVQQITNAIAEVEREEKAAAQPVTT